MKKKKIIKKYYRKPNIGFQYKWSPLPNTIQKKEKLNSKIKKEIICSTRYVYNIDFNANHLEYVECYYVE